MSTSTEKMHEAERELRYRRWVYPGWVKSGKITPHAAQIQIKLMQEIFEDYRAIVAMENPDLFGGSE